MDTDTAEQVREALRQIATLAPEPRRALAATLVDRARVDPEAVEAGRAAAHAMWRDETARREPLHAFVVALRMLAIAPRRGDIELLARVAGYGYVLPDASTVAARALERLAQTDPCPELRMARRSLRGGPLRPPACAAAWKAIDAATATGKDLPVSASATHPVDLPRPSEGPDA